MSNGLPDTSNVKDNETKRVFDSIIVILRQMKKEIDTIKHNKKNR